MCRSTAPKAWDELTILWNDLTILCIALTIDWNDLTWNDLTMERNDRIPKYHRVSANNQSLTYESLRSQI